MLNLWVFRARGGVRVSALRRLGRRPVPQRGGQRPPALRAAAADPRGRRRRLRDHLQPRSLHRRAPRTASARSAMLDPRVKMLRLSRRFGQPAATMAGLRMASGDAVVVIDCDLQDPPELIGEMIERWSRGLRRRLRAAPLARGRDAAQADGRRARLPVIRRVAEVDIPPEHRRLPPDEPPRGGRGAAPQRDPRLPARAGRAGRLPADERALRPRPARRPATATTTASPARSASG